MTLRQRSMLHRRALMAAALLWLAASLAGCAMGADNPRETRSGTWQGETAFGSFTFTVCEGGRRIENYRLEYTTGGVTQALAPSGGDEILVDKEGAFDLIAPEAGLVFQGQFSADGKSASGLWEIVTPEDGTLSEEWTVVR